MCRDNMIRHVTPRRIEDMYGICQMSYDMKYIYYLFIAYLLLGQADL